MFLDCNFLFTGIQLSLQFFTADKVDITKHDLARLHRIIYGVIEWPSFLPRLNWWDYWTAGNYYIYYY